jgi:predicted solute-binding protein
MSEDVRTKHIQLYVNDFSINVGEKGSQAISLFLEKAGIKKISNNIFINPSPIIS